MINTSNQETFENTILGIMYNNCHQHSEFESLCLLAFHVLSNLLICLVRIYMIFFGTDIKLFTRKTEIFIENYDK